jgi:tRNA threonylcarbamoyladenosine biosynthesis protein TsaE
LPHLQATWRLGRELAAYFSHHQPFPLLLEGDLGCGKTTLVQALVDHLPGSELAEVNSPSFNICNVYPTQPPVAHFDLYRLDETGPDESLFEYLADPTVLVIVEWAQHLAWLWRPPEYLRMAFTSLGSKRSLKITPCGAGPENLYGTLQSLV